MKIKRIQAHEVKVGMKMFPLGWTSGPVAYPVTSVLVEDGSVFIELDSVLETMNWFEYDEVLSIQED